jgi:hypothetical protein
LRIFAFFLAFLLLLLLLATQMLKIAFVKFGHLTAGNTMLIIQLLLLTWRFTLSLELLNIFLGILQIVISQHRFVVLKTCLTIQVLIQINLRKRINNIWIDIIGPLLTVNGV